MKNESMEKRFLSLFFCKSGEIGEKPRGEDVFEK